MIDRVIIEWGIYRDCYVRGRRESRVLIAESDQWHIKGYQNIPHQIRDQTHNFEILALGTYARLSWRGSNVREHGRLVRDQGRRRQRPEASHPSSGLPDFLEVRPVQKHQDASVVPFLVRDVQHLGVERPLDGDRGPCHVAACLDERETFAPSSLRRGFSNDQKTDATAVTHKSDKKKATKREERERGQWAIEVARLRWADDRVLAFRGGRPRPGELIQRATRPKHRSGGDLSLFNSPGFASRPLSPEIDPCQSRLGGRGR